MQGAELQQRISEMLNDFAEVERTLGVKFTFTAGTTAECPYCTRPEGWDACPIHRDHD
jgi:hypothetical protein